MSNDTLDFLPTQAPNKTDTIFYYAEFIRIVQILCYTWPVMILFGFVANIINIVVFLKTSVKDNVTILLLSLSFSDLAFLVFVTPRVSGIVIDFLVPSFQWPFHSLLVSFLPYWPATTLYDISAFISVSLGMMRCACVAMPLKFKFVFTRSRTIKWVFFLVVLAVLLRLPVLTIFRITWRTDPRTNVTALYLASVNRASMSRINDILNRGFLIWFNYLTMIACVIVLSYKLYQSSKIRKTFTVTGFQTSEQASDKAAALSMSTKDLQVVKSVVLVCCIFIMSQLSFFLVSTTRLLVPAFDEGNDLAFLFGIFSQISNTCSYLNASINIFVYYNYNSKYRSILRSCLSDDKDRLEFKKT